ncbi:MAG TPA: hypothetical protein VNN22_17795 [Verrucomicrobiae bacterium]|nr:hypothetical protein [Verrucomicrobiae bacterium]
MQARGLSGGGASARVRPEMGLFTKRNKETERFYLLPGQGGAAYRRKQRYMLGWSIVVGLLVSGVLIALICYLNRP